MNAEIIVGVFVSVALHLLHALYGQAGSRRAYGVEAYAYVPEDLISIDAVAVQGIEKGE